MQSAKDSFYIALRDRLAAVNPYRTIAVRGALRPAIVVPENELDCEAADPLETFLIFWEDEVVDTTEALPLHTMPSQIRYTTQGTKELTGMDRGRVLAAMDRELLAMLQPQTAAKQDFRSTPATVMQTVIFWSTAKFGAAVVKDGQISRTVTVSVFSHQEAGE